MKFGFSGEIKTLIISNIFLDFQIFPVPEMLLIPDDWEMVALVNREVAYYIQLLEDAREREAISAVFSISRLGNQLMQHNTPWKLVKVIEFADFYQLGQT